MCMSQTLQANRDFLYFRDTILTHISEFSSNCFHRQARTDQWPKTISLCSKNLRVDLFTKNMTVKNTVKEKNFLIFQSTLRGVNFKTKICINFCTSCDHQSWIILSSFFLF